MSLPITVGIIGGTGKTGQSVVQGLLSSPTNFVRAKTEISLDTITDRKSQKVTSFTRHSSLKSEANQKLEKQGVQVEGYDLSQPRDILVNQLKKINVLISCITWEHLSHQIPWIEAAKEAGVARFVPSEWVGPAPLGVIDIKDKVRSSRQQNFVQNI